MRRLALALGLCLAATAAHADGTIDTLLAGGALTGTESIPMFQTANPAVKTTPLAIGTYYSTLAITETNKTLTAPVMTAPVLGTPASGVATNLTGLPLTTGVTGILPIANGGTATATPGLVAGTNVTITGSWPNQTINSSGGGGGGITTVTGGGNTTTGVTTLAMGTGFTSTPNGASATATVNLTPPIRTAAAPTLATTDLTGQVNISSGALTIPASVFTATSQSILAVNYGASPATITNTSGLTINAGGGCVSGNGIPIAGAWQLIYNGTSLDCIQTISGAINSGTAVLGTAAIASAACATVVTVAGTGILTTDVIAASFNGDPTAVTGYIPSTSGMLTIIAYPTAGNANFKVCNNTSASITPGAVTLNWRVVR